MAVRNHIRPAIVRGSLVHQVADVQFAEFRGAACAWSATRALHDLQDPQVPRMRGNVRNDAAFSEARRPEAELAARIRRIRRHRNGRAVPLSADDQYIFQRASVRQEYDYRRADSDDAEVVRLRLTRGGIVANVKAGVRS